MKKNSKKKLKKDFKKDLYDTLNDNSLRLIKFTIENTCTDGDMLPGATQVKDYMSVTEHRKVRSWMESFGFCKSIIVSKNGDKKGLKRSILTDRPRLLKLYNNLNLENL